MIISTRNRIVFFKNTIEIAKPCWGGKTIEGDSFPNRPLVVVIGLAYLLPRPELVLLLLFEEELLLVPEVRLLLELLFGRLTLPELLLPLRPLLLLLLLGRLTLLLPVLPLLLVPLGRLLSLLGRLTLLLLPVLPLLVPLGRLLSLLGRLTLPLLPVLPLFEPPTVPLFGLWLLPFDTEPELLLLGAGGLALPLFELPELMLPPSGLGLTVAPPLLLPPLGAGGLPLFQLGEPG